MDPKIVFEEVDKLEYKLRYYEYLIRMTEARRLLCEHFEADVCDRQLYTLRSEYLAIAELLYHFL
jgi:hypothetical protein